MAYYLGGYDAANDDADHRSKADLHARLYDELAALLDVQVLAEQVRALRSFQSQNPKDATFVQLAQTTGLPNVYRAGV